MIRHLTLLMVAAAAVGCARRQDSRLVDRLFVIRALGDRCFGDFDADGRTDVIRVNNHTIEVSWAGGSRWNPLIRTNAALADIAVGYFDDDRRGIARATSNPS